MENSLFFLHLLSELAAFICMPYLSAHLIQNEGLSPETAGTIISLGIVVRLSSSVAMSKIKSLPRAGTLLVLAGVLETLCYLGIGIKFQFWTVILAIVLGNIAVSIWSPSISAVLLTLSTPANSRLLSNMNMASAAAVIVAGQVSNKLVTKSTTHLFIAAGLISVLLTIATLRIRTTVNPPPKAPNNLKSESNSLRGWALSAITLAFWLVYACFSNYMSPYFSTSNLSIGFTGHAFTIIALAEFGSGYLAKRRIIGEDAFFNLTILLILTTSVASFLLKSQTSILIVFFLIVYGAVTVFGSILLPTLFSNANRDIQKSQQAYFLSKTTGLALGAFIGGRMFAGSTLNLHVWSLFQCLVYAVIALSLMAYHRGTKLCVKQ